jgi:hypothetical protein
LIRVRAEIVEIGAQDQIVRRVRKHEEVPAPIHPYAVVRCALTSARRIGYQLRRTRPRRAQRFGSFVSFESLLKDKPIHLAVARDRPKHHRQNASQNSSAPFIEAKICHAMRGV